MQSATSAIRAVEPDARAVRDRLVTEYLPLVRCIAGAIRSSPLGARIPFDDLYAYGAHGLLEALDRFDPTRGVPFEAFSRYRIRGAIVDGIRREHWLSRRTYKRLCDERIALDQRPANDVGDTTPSTAYGRAPGPQSLDELDNADGTRARGETVGQTDARWNGRRMIQLPVEEDDSLFLRVKAAIRELPERERQVIELRYFGEKRLTEAGAELGMQRSWACRLHARAIATLRTALNSAARTSAR